METTIAAISTAYGESGIGVIRISGPDSLSVLKKLFPGHDDMRPRYMYHGYIVDPKNGERVDEALCVFMKGPSSYTGEDVAEIQCHGSVVSLKKILSLCFSCGAEPAEKGEFTKRAFLNGRMDLSQAEAVIDLIKARTARSFDTAFSQMQGSLSEKIRSVRKQLLDLLVDLQVNMDYPDEDIELITYEKIKNHISSISDQLNKLLALSHTGKIVRDGISVVIAGRPNVGKSSLMNGLLRQSRSIVTSVPGTTRDTVEESVNIHGISVRLTDTAGIHETDDIVEGLGIERSREAFNEADVVILVIDASLPLGEEDKTLLKMLEGRKSIVVLNKQDLSPLLNKDDIIPYGPDLIVTTSLAEAAEDAVSSDTEKVEDALVKLVESGDVHLGKDLILSNTRHIHLIEQALAELSEALSQAEMMSAIDFIEVNCRCAFNYLGEITGDTAGDEVINEIFSRFCLGK